jgi:hypothetical protein
MKDPAQLKKLGIVMMIFLFPLTVFSVFPLIKTKSSLTAATGFILSQGHYHEAGGARKSTIDAETLNINGYPSFAIRDNVKAYDYLLNNVVVGKQATVLYDENGFNGFGSHPGLTFHVYGLTIDGDEIMTMSEAKHPYLVYFSCFALLELFFTGLFFYAKKLKNQQLSLPDTNTEKTI